MATPILTTKLHIPPPRPALVSRPRLIARLDEGVQLGHRLTLVSAPAGFGKTTLLSEWLHGKGVDTASLPVAWVSLDEGDNDVVRFWSYVVAALQTVQLGMGQMALAAFQAPQLPPLDAILIALINEIAATEGLILVLDDYHLVKAQAVHDSLTFFLDRQPPQMHLVLASRADPLLPIARLRGRGQVTELREADLRFTPDEAAAFLNRVAGLGLAADDVAALEQRTEGWITGLQLAALALQPLVAEPGALARQGQDDVSGFIQTFTGSNRYVLDYLTEEVLQRQSKSVQAFLLETSILERLTGPLCDAVCFSEAETPTSLTETGAKSMLEALDQANLFLVPLDNERRWYRYHRLFADLLRARLEDAQPGRVPELHRRASAWYEQNGLLDDAVSHAIAAGDLTRVGSLIETYGMRLLMHGELNTLQRWIAALPEPMIQASARICVSHAWVLLLTGQLLAVEPCLQQAERRLAAALVDDQLDDLRGDIATIRAYVAAQQGDVERTIELAHLALERLASDSWGERGIVSFVLAAAYMLCGDVTAAGEAMAEASTVGQRGGNIHIAVPALNALAGIQTMQGRLRQAQATAQEAIRLATGPGGRLLPIAGGALSALADLAQEWNDLEGALAYARQSVELSQQWGNSDTLCSTYLTLALALRTQGDLEGAHDALREAERLSGDLATTPMFPMQLRAAWARLWLAQGNLAALARWAADVTASAAPAVSAATTTDLSNPVYAPEALALARVRLALGQPHAATQGLAPLLQASRAQGLTTVIIEALALQALAYDAQAEMESALAALAEALTLAEPEGYVRTFVDLGPAMALLLQQAGAAGASPDYVQRLLAAFAAKEQPPPPARAQPLVEPLSERELEVLCLIAAGLSNREIAEELVVAVSTVKSHANHIFGKLDVKSRTQAVVRAKELGLL